jgi:ribokinase
MNYDEHQRRENERPDELWEREDWLERWRLFSPTPEDAGECRAWADCIHLAAMPVERQTALLEYFRDAEKSVTVDIPWSPGAMGPLDLPPVALASAIFLSDAELRGHFGGLPEEEAAKQLIERGAKLIAIKHGTRGSTIYRAGDRYGATVPAFRTTVLDPTGAGDAYCGGFAVGLWLTGDPLASALYGTVSASFVIEGFSAGHALAVESRQADERLNALRQQAKLPT